MNHVNVLNSFADIFGLLAIILHQYAFSYEQAEKYDRATVNLIVGSLALIMFIVIKTIAIFS